MPASFPRRCSRRRVEAKQSRDQEDKAMIASTPAPEVVKRRKMERAVCSALVKAGLEAGYGIGVYNGEETVIRNSTSYKAIMAELFSVDEESLLFWKDGKKAGHVFLVYGNDGWDVICDYTTNLEHIMERPNRVSDRLQGC